MTLKSLELVRKRGKFFLSFFTLEGKLKQQIWISARRRPCGTCLSKQLCPTLTWLVYRKLLKAPRNPQNNETGQLDNWNQARWVYSLYLHQKIVFYYAFLSFVIFNSIQCHLEHTNCQWPKVEHNTVHFRWSHSTQYTFIKLSLFDKFLESWVRDACGRGNQLYNDLNSPSNYSRQNILLS